MELKINGATRDVDVPADLPLLWVLRDDQVPAPSAVIAKFGASARAGIDAVNALPDADTADLLTEISPWRRHTSVARRGPRRDEGLTGTWT
jgi:hypothetical protein